LFANPCAATGEPDDVNGIQVALKVAEAPRLVPLDQREGLIQPTQDVGSRDVRSCIVDDNRNSTDDKRFNSHGQ
jgi:hypothetical protein